MHKPNAIKILRTVDAILRMEDPNVLAYHFAHLAYGLAFPNDRIEIRPSMIRMMEGCDRDAAVAALGNALAALAEGDKYQAQTEVTCAMWRLCIVSAGPEDRGSDYYVPHTYQPQA
jgi:hypothetical protein